MIVATLVACLSVGCKTSSERLRETDANEVTVKAIDPAIHILDFIGNLAQDVDLQRTDGRFPIKSNVLVPTHIWKVLYSPTQKKAGAYVITNDETKTYSSVTVSDLEKMVGVSLLPGLSQKIRDGGMVLPKPQAQHGSKKSKAKAEDEFKLSDFSRTILDAIKRASQ